MKGRATAGQYAPNPQGHTRITMDRTMRSDPERRSGPLNLFAVGIEVWNRPHEHGAPSIRVSSARGEYVPAFCTHRPSLQRSEARLRLRRNGSVETGSRDDAKVVRISAARTHLDKQGIRRGTCGWITSYVWDPSGDPTTLILIHSSVDEVVSGFLYSLEVLFVYIKIFTLYNQNQLIYYGT